MHPYPTIEIDLAAIVRNYALLGSRLKNAACAAVVKADAYGLGATHVAPALHAAGCRHFFVATLEEGVALRGMLAAHTPEPAIYVFHGARGGQIADFKAHRLIPVLNDMGQIEAWNKASPAALHIDTGMRRLGIAPSEAESASKKLKPGLIISHLACANETENPMNRQQLEDFRAALKHFAQTKASLANSSGIFLGADYHFDFARPGCSLYGISPNTGLPNPMENVVTLSAPVLQYRRIEKPQSVGYGATATAEAGTVLATVEIGYADGFLRSLSNKAHGFAAGVQVPLIGRVSMDMVTVDVTAVPEHLRTPELRVTFIGSEQPVDTLAKQAGTIGYEIFTRLGSRVKRVYKS